MHYCVKLLHLKKKKMQIYPMDNCTSAERELRPPSIEMKMIRVEIIMVNRSITAEIVEYRLKVDNIFSIWILWIFLIYDFVFSKQNFNYKFNTTITNTIVFQSYNKNCDNQIANWLIWFTDANRQCFFSWNSKYSKYWTVEYVIKHTDIDDKDLILGSCIYIYLIEIGSITTNFFEISYLLCTIIDVFINFPKRTAFKGLKDVTHTKKLSKGIYRKW